MDKRFLEIPNIDCPEKRALLMAPRKVCRICKEEKPKSEFRPEKGNKDKLNNACAVCYDLNRRAQYKKNPAPHNASVKAWNERNPEKYKAVRDRRSKEFKAQNPLIAAAWACATYALKKGEIVKEPCAICGNPKVEMHHPSHEQPFWKTVQFLCDLHHGRANKMKGFKFYTKELDAEHEKRYQQGKVELVRCDDGTLSSTGR